MITAGAFWLFWRRKGLKSSALNQLKGKITSVENGIITRESHS